MAIFIHENSWSIHGHSCFFRHELSWMGHELPSIIFVTKYNINSWKFMINSWAFVFKKTAYVLLLRRHTTNAYNYMQSKISVIAIRVQKKRIYMRCLLGKEQQISLYFSESESHSHEFRHCMQCQSSNWLISTITLTI